MYFGEKSRRRRAHNQCSTPMATSCQVPPPARSPAPRKISHHVSRDLRVKRKMRLLEKPGCRRSISDGEFQKIHSVYRRYEYIVGFRNHKWGLAVRSFISTVTLLGYSYTIVGPRPAKGLIKPPSPPGSNLLSPKAGAKFVSWRPYIPKKIGRRLCGVWGFGGQQGPSY